jgi:hypothetical protein
MGRIQRCGLAATLLAMAIVLLAGPSAGGDELELIPFGSEWRYSFFPYEGTIGSSIPPDVGHVDFDDSEWAVADAPFGLSDPSCEVDVASPWIPASHVIVLRRRLSLPNEMLPLYLSILIKHHANLRLAVDNRWVSFAGGCYCPWADFYWYDSWFSATETEEHVVVIASGPNGPCAHRYLDGVFRLIIPTGAPSPPARSWGMVKALYRESAIIRGGE